MMWSAGRGSVGSSSRLGRGGGDGGDGLTDSLFEEVPCRVQVCRNCQSVCGSLWQACGRGAYRGCLADPTLRRAAACERERGAWISCWAGRDYGVSTWLTWLRLPVRLLSSEQSGGKESQSREQEACTLTLSLSPHTRSRGGLSQLEHCCHYRTTR